MLGFGNSSEARMQNWGWILSWLPLLFIVAFWVYFMRIVARRSEKQSMHMEKVERLLERIAAAVEKGA